MLKTRSSLLMLLLLGVPTAVSSAATFNVPKDHKTIQAAIDAARAGDTVLVSAGTYNGRIRMKPGVALRSAGDNAKGKLGHKRAESTILDGGGQAGKGPGVTMAEGATLDGFTVTNVGVYDDALWKKHNATHGDQQLHEHIGHFGAPGIGVVGVSCLVTNNIVHHNGDTGIGIRGEKGKRCSPQVIANVCYRNMGGGIGSMQGSSAMIEANVCFQNFYAGIGHNNARPVVTGNICYENVRAGIGISEGAQPVVRNNKCYRNRRAGIGIRTTARTSPVVENNDCYENDMAGIGTEEHATPIIRNNRCYRNKMAGIGCRSHAQPVIVGNFCYENQMAGIGSRDNAQPLIIRNESRKNQKAGIGVRSGAVALIYQNKCIENKLVAIGLPDGATAFIHGNELIRTGGVPPLIAIKGGATAVLSDNLIRGGGVAGILVQGNARITGNRFLGKGPGQGSAVWVWKESFVAVDGNQFKGYRNALNASGSVVRASNNRVSEFQGAAIIVKKSLLPAHVFGNTAFSTNQKDKAVDIDGPIGIVADNEVKPPMKTEETPNQP